MDREKVIKGLTSCSGSDPCVNICPYYDNSGNNYSCTGKLAKDALALLKEQEKKKFFVDSDGKITPLPDIVRCKDCVHRGKVEKCVLAAIAAEKDFPLFMLDNHGEWYCADGRREAEEK